LSSNTDKICPSNAGLPYPKEIGGKKKKKKRKKEMNMQQKGRERKE